MPLPQFNFGYGAYDSDDGSSYCLKGDASWQAAGASGSSACAGEPAYGRATARRAPRRGIFRDPTTFRTQTVPYYTPAAYAAAVVGTDTIAVAVPGQVATVTYTLVKKIGERIPSTVIGQQRPDHA